MPQTASNILGIGCAEQARDNVNRLHRGKHGNINAKRAEKQTILYTVAWIITMAEDQDQLWDGIGIK